MAKKASEPTPTATKPEGPVQKKPEGAMTKKQSEPTVFEGPLLKRAAIKILGWHLRHFKLTATRLLYYRSSDVAASVGENPRGRIKLADVTQLEFAEKTSSGKKWVIIMASQSAVWTMRADSERDFLLWKSQLEKRTYSQGVTLRDRGDSCSSLSTVASPTPAETFGAISAGASTPAKVAEGGGRPESVPEGILSVPPTVAEFKPQKSLERVVARPVAGARAAMNKQSVRLQDVYAIVREIDRGCNGSVFEGMNLKTRERVAIKEVDISVSSEDENQLEVWQQLHHENVVQLLDFFKMQNKLYFVMELATGRDLFYGVMQHYHGDTPRGYAEKDAVDLLTQLMSALRHLHLRRIVHCDLKPENILLVAKKGEEGKKDIKHIKLADWGYAQIMGSNTRQLTRFVGTLNYMAPEILSRKPFNEKADIWSAGVIAFILLCGFPPYDTVVGADGTPNLAASLKRLLGKCDPETGRWTHFPVKYWGSVSQAAKDCVSAMLTFNEEKRPSAEEILQMPFLLEKADAAVEPLPRVMEHMRRFNSGRARTFIEHDLGAVLARTRHGSAIAAAAGSDDTCHILEEEGWQPLISLGWSSDADDRLIAANALANLSLKGEQATVLVREGGLRLLLHLADIDQDDVLHHVAVALSQLALERPVHERMLKGDVAAKLVRIGSHNNRACRFQSARALSRLAFNPDTHDSIWAANGVEAIVMLAKQDDFESMRLDAMKALWNMMDSEERRPKLLALMDASAAESALPPLMEECREWGKKILTDGGNPPDLPSYRHESVSGPACGDGQEVVGVPTGLGQDTPLTLADFVSEDPPFVQETGSGTMERMIHKGSGAHVCIKFLSLELVAPESRKKVLDEVIKAYACASPAPDMQEPMCPTTGPPSDWGRYIINFHGAFYDGPSHQIGIVIDYWEAINLQSMYEAHHKAHPDAKGLPERYIASICLQVLRGLAYMHARRVIHRDIKPQAVLIDWKGQVCITSLGNVRYLTNTRAQAQTLVGTQCYMAPERIMAVGFSSTVDVWSLGLIAMECAIGRYPFAAAKDRYIQLLDEIINGNPVEMLSDDFSEEFRSFVGLCLTKKGQERPGAMRMLKHPFITAVEDNTDIRAEVGDLAKALSVHSTVACPRKVAASPATLPGAISCKERTLEHSLGTFLGRNNLGFLGWNTAFEHFLDGTQPWTVPSTLPGTFPAPWKELFL